jgi:MHS family proline/betaine transporter-like MFS transporter
MEATGQGTVPTPRKAVVAAAIRNGGFSIGYIFSVAIFGGTAPYIATYLVSSTGNPLSPVYYVIAAAVITLVTILTMRETSHAPLAQTTATDAG